MNFKTLSSQKGIISITVYWLEWSLDLIPLAFAIYCIYMCVLLALKYWLKVNGSGTLICTVFAIIFAILSVVTNILNQFSLIQTLQRKMKYIHFGVSILALIIHAVLLSFFTPITQARSSIDFYEYTMNNYQTDSNAKYYYDLYATQPYDVHKVIWDRTVSQKIPLTSFFVLWGICFSLYFLGVNYTETRKSNSSRRQSFQEQDQADLQPLRQMPENENDDINGNNEEDNN